MPPGRTARARATANENDENTAGTRMTRAKAAALNVDELSLPPKPLQNKKITSTGITQAGRRRAALGDVSNVSKAEAAAKKGSKTVATKINRVQKPSTTTSRTTALAAREAKVDAKATRSGSGVGALPAGPKRKAATTTTITTTTTATTLIKDEVMHEAEPPTKKLHVAEAKENKHRTAHAPAEMKVEPAPAAVAAPAAAAAAAAPPQESSKAVRLEEVEDPTTVAEYADDIFEYLRDLEPRSLPNPSYMDHQDDLEWKTRGILVDWLIEVHQRFHLLPETLFLTINIVDRFLSEKIVQLDRLQLVGITAMFIASKYEEILSPHVGNFKSVADDGYTEEEILAAERFILATLNYDLSYPNPLNFLRRISQADNYDVQCRTIGKYLLESSLLDHRLMGYRQSHIAAAAMYLSRFILDRGEWNDALVFYSGYTEEEIEPVFMLMIDYLARPIVHEAFFKKYAGKKFMKASIMIRSWARKNAQFFGITDISKSLDELDYN